MYEFPLEMFLSGSDLSPLKEHIDRIIYGLTKWEPKIEKTGVFSPVEKVSIHGNDYQDALDNMNHLFLGKLWGDGLPLEAPTDERVNWLLAGTDLPRDTVVGVIMPKGGIATVEAVAVSLAMAGGRPEYMPVLLAAVAAVTEPKWKLQEMNATTCSVYPAVMVNGPVARQVRLNSGYGCLGPDPKHPAGAAIGRAMRFLLMNLGGSMPGSGTMAIYGGPARYTGTVFAEDEDGIPTGWEPLNIERNFPRGSNVVTVAPVSSTTNILGTGVGTKEDALATLHLQAAFMRTPNRNYWSYDAFGEEAFTGIVLIPRGVARGFVECLGWGKKEVKSFLWEHSKYPWSEVIKVFPRKHIEDMIGFSRGILAEGEPWPITPKPENIIIFVAGGIQSGHNYWMQVGHAGYRAVSKEIRLPDQWHELLRKADEDLGPIAAEQMIASPSGG